MDSIVNSISVSIVFLSFYVVSKAGVLIYSQQVITQDNFENQLSPLLVAGFFSAIEHFAQEFAKANLDIIEMGDYTLRFSFQTNIDYIFCLVYQKSDEAEKYKHLLNTLKMLFIYTFKDKLVEKPHNLTPYKNFDPVLEIMLEAFEIKNQIIKIEHFICGSFGELRDFQSKNGLLCPNCEKLLQQEGVDYRIKQD